jgi:hypothetical protein
MGNELKLAGVQLKEPRNMIMEERSLCVGRFLHTPIDPSHGACEERFHMMASSSVSACDRKQIERRRRCILGAARKKIRQWF